jgi:hypothetical protein
LEVEVERVKIVTPDNISLLGWFHKKDLKNLKQSFIFMAMLANLKIEFTN